MRDFLFASGFLDVSIEEVSFCQPNFRLSHETIWALEVNSVFE